VLVPGIGIVGVVVPEDDAVPVKIVDDDPLAHP
jgi:hypothetical protein